MNITDNLFLAVSQKLNVRVTPDNLRVKMDQVSSNGGINPKVKTDILTELLLAVSQLESKINDGRREEATESVQSNP